LQRSLFTTRFLSRNKTRCSDETLRRYRRHMAVLRRLAECVLGLVPRDASVVVVHEPSSRYLGPGLALGVRSEAVTFDDAESAEVFLARHASEPTFAVIRAAEALDATAA
jgi:hypothetical protein